MSQVKKIAALAVALFLLISGILAAGISFRIKPERVRHNLVRTIEQVSGGSLRYGRFHFSYFPYLTAEFRDAALSRDEKNHTVLKAGRMNVRLRLLSALFGKTDISTIEMQEGSLATGAPAGAASGRLELNRMNLRLRSLRTSGPVEMEFSAGIEEAGNVLSGKARFEVPRWDKWDWGKMAAAGDLRLSEFPLAPFKEKGAEKFPFQPHAGTASGRVRFKKEAGEEWLAAEGKVSLRKFVYLFQKEESRAASPEIDADLDLSAGWNSREVLIKRAVISSPVGKIEAGGRLAIRTGEVKDFRISVSGLVMESLPHYFISLKEAIPLNLGFSGLSDLEASLEGTPDHLSLHANWDLTAALLTYARYFSKPKDLPLNLAFDYLLKDARELSGDFSVRFQNAAIKGTLANYDLRKGHGQLSVVTNKFPLSGWELLLPPFENYNLKGGMKLLANLSGDFQKPKASRLVLNWTLENAAVEPKTGGGVHDLNLALDYSAMSLEVKKLEFQTADSPVRMNFTVYNPAESPIAKGKLSSPHLVPSSLFPAIQAAGSEWLPLRVRSRIEGLQKSVEAFLPAGEALENFSAAVNYKDKQWFVEDVRFEAYEGKSKGKAGIDFSKPRAVYWIEPEVDHLSLARFLARRESGEKPVAGSFFLKGRLEGEIPERGDWPKTLRGRGEFSITNGEFDNFDVLGTLRKIETFSKLGDPPSGSTPFHDVRSKFLLEDEKITTEKLILLSDELSVKANGDILLDGSLNYRLDVYLSPALASPVLLRFFGNPAPEARGREEQKLGPVPLLLSGPFHHPEIKPDPNLLSQFQEELEKKKVQKVLRNFLPEDFFFENRKSS